jgi:hypothetical protein
VLSRFNYNRKRLHHLVPVARPHMEDSSFLDETLYCCCRDGLLSDVLRHIAKGANVNWANPKEGNATSVYVASYNGHDKVVEALANAGADVNACNRAGMFSLFIAAQYVALWLRGICFAKYHLKVTGTPQVQSPRLREGPHPVTRQHKRVHTERHIGSLHRFVYRSCCMRPSAAAGWCRPRCRKQLFRMRTATWFPEDLEAAGTVPIRLLGRVNL